MSRSAGLLAPTSKADVGFTGQNGKVADSNPVLSNSCKKAKKVKGKGMGHKPAGRLLPRLDF